MKKSLERQFRWSEGIELKLVTKLPNRVYISTRIWLIPFPTRIDAEL